MPELRWILLVLGALLIGGLWWWELRRSRQAGPPAGIPPVTGDARAPERFEPRFDCQAAAAEPADVPSIRATEDRTVPRGDPPVVTLDDLPEDPDRVVLAREPVVGRRPEPHVRREPPPPDAWSDEEVVPDLDAVPPLKRPAPADAAGRVSAPEPRVAASRSPFARREPSIETTPDLGRSPAPPLLEPASIASTAPAARTASATAAPTASSAAERTSGAGAGTNAPSAAAAPGAAGSGYGATSPGASSSSPGGGAATPGIEARRPAPRPASSTRVAAAPETARQPAPEPPSTHQRIVAIRLVATEGERFDGDALRAALEGEGMRYGKYSIFHRQRADGRAIYSVASLVEPGSFDLDRMHMQQFPGVSMFAVFPGPIDAPEAFDELLATARRLADRLGGVLQDERGGALSAQRVLGIREELVSFQNLVTRMRSRPAG